MNRDPSFAAHCCRGATVLAAWRWRGAAALIALAATSCAADPATPPQAGGATTALPADVHRFDGIDFAAPTADLAPLAAIIGEARLVGLGETAHRSGGILKAKNRVIRYAVEVLGFRVVGIETEWTDAEAANRYVQTGQGDALAVTRQHLRETWHDRSTADLLAWLAEFNRAHPEDPVTFIGFNNMQPWHDVAALSAFARQRLPQEAETIGVELARCYGAAAGSLLAFAELEADEAAAQAASLDHCFAKTDPSFLMQLGPGEIPPFPETGGYRVCLTAIEKIEAALATRPTDDGAAARVRLHAESLRGWEDWSCNGPTPTANNSRDAAMASILMHQLHVLRPDARAIISAHSLHLNRAPTALATRFPPPLVEMELWEKTQRMGGWLEEKLGAGYVVISFHAQRHSEKQEWVAPPPAAATAGEPPVVEATLHALSEPWLIVNLRPGVSTTFATGAPYRFLFPLGVEATAVVEAPLTRQYDGLVFLDEAEPWVGLEAP